MIFPVLGLFDDSSRSGIGHGMKTPPTSLPLARGVTLVEVLISLLLVITGLLGVVAIQGHMLTTGKNVEQHTQALLILDTLEESLRANHAKNAMAICQPGALKSFERKLQEVIPGARLSLRRNKDECATFVREGVSVFVFEIEWKKLNAVQRSNDLSTENVVISREVVL